MSAHSLYTTDGKMGNTCCPKKRKMKGNAEQDFLSSHSDSFDDEFCKMEMEQEDDGGSDRLQIDTVRICSTKVV